MKKQVTAEEFDRMVDAGEDVSHLLEPAGNKTVNIDLPIWVIEELDAAAGRRNVARKALINIWLIDRLEAERLQVAGRDRRKEKAG